MVRAHRQAWAWQDEWDGLTMEDIREIERQTQLALQAKMGEGDSSEDIGAGEDTTEEKGGSSNTPQDSEQVTKTLAANFGSIEKAEDPQSPASLRKPSDIPIINTAVSSEGENTPEDSPIEVAPPRYIFTFN